MSNGEQQVFKSWENLAEFRLK